MGNRAVVVFEGSFDNGKTFDRGCAVYLHWNGGSESIYAFLEEMDRRKMRTNDPSYETARFIHIVGDFMDKDKITTLSLGVFNLKGTSDKELKECHPGDNGIYVVNRALKTVRRYVFKGLKDKWLTKKEVEKEREAALKDSKYNGILEILLEDRKGKEVEE